MIGAYLRQGLVAGLLAGLLAGLFGFAFGEPVLDEAIRQENSAHDQHGAATDGEHETFSRGTQKVGLFLGVALYGTAVGGAFGLVSAYFRSRLSTPGEWARSLVLAGAVFCGAVLLPLLKYPPNPPGVGADPGTLAARTTAYLAMVFLSLLALYFTWRLARGLNGFSMPIRHLLIAGFLLVSWGLLLLIMPGSEGAGEAPADLVWNFRLSALGTQAVLWAGIGCSFGLLGERAEARRTRPGSTFSLQGGPR